MSSKLFGNGLTTEQRSYIESRKSKDKFLSPPYDVNRIMRLTHDLNNESDSKNERITYRQVREYLEDLNNSETSRAS